MIIVGEKINTSRKRVEQAVRDRDADFIGALAREQVAAGAHYVDVNAGTFVGEEAECLCWLVDTVQAAVDTPLCLDSPSPQALAAAMLRHKGEPLVNSISLEPDRYDQLLPVVTSRPCQVVALCMAAASMPTTVEERVAAATELVGRLTAAGIPIEKIYVDPLVQPVSIDTRMGTATLGAIRKVMDDFPGVNTICGLSNISFGLPQRRLINRMFLGLCVGQGLNSAILDPTDRPLMSALLASEMLLNRDEYCERFIDAVQADRIGG